MKGKEQLAWLRLDMAKVSAHTRQCKTGAFAERRKKGKTRKWGEDEEEYSSCASLCIHLVFQTAAFVNNEDEWF